MQQTPEKERRSTNSGQLNGQKSNGSDLGGDSKFFSNGAKIGRSANRGGVRVVFV